MRTILTLGLIGLCGACFGQDVDNDKPKLRAGNVMTFHRAELEQLPGGGIAIFTRRDLEGREVRIVGRVVIEMEPAPDDPRKKIVTRRSFDISDWRRDPAGWQTLWDRKLERQLQLAARRYQLTDAEEKKLRIAAKGDAKRLHDRFEQARDEFESIRGEPDKALQFLGQTVHPLRMRIERGPCGKDSLYAKILRGMAESRAPSEDAGDIPHEDGPRADG